MKSFQNILLLAGWFAAGGLPAMAETWTTAAGEDIPDAPDTGGLLSTFDLAGGDPQLAGNDNPILARIDSIQLTISGGWNGDYSITLFHVLADDSIQSVVLLDRIGVDGTHPDGFENAGMDDVTIVAGQPDIEIFGGSYTDMSVLTGTYGLGGGANFAAFADSTLLGTWGLHLVDNSPGSEGTLVNWSMTINVVPEPANLFGAGLLLLGAGHFWRRQQCA